MGIEGGSNSEVQNQEINQANNEQNEMPFIRLCNQMMNWTVSQKNAGVIFT